MRIVIEPFDTLHTCWKTFSLIDKIILVISMTLGVIGLLIGSIFLGISLLCFKAWNSIVDRKKFSIPLSGYDRKRKGREPDIE